MVHHQEVQKRRHFAPGDDRAGSSVRVAGQDVPFGPDLLFTATDVIHAWTIPAFGVKLDNMPGRINETWTRITKPGRYYGQCSELCGVDHSNMPIVVDAVSKEEYQRWVEQEKAGLTPSLVPGADAVKLASAQ